MPMLLFIVMIGAAAGFFATRVMKVQADVPTTVVIGIAGALVGWFALRVLATLTGWAAVFIGAILGAMALIWIWQKYLSR
ncbi:GlsB/YeaQ/YmgE family stress response membrane protein [Aliigemmobacter aestuarii]|uniref:GlsB/YeaQ/YmgE family stress response membrane protein n=1 Tax=Aliigemmobacter aestuarii TaxID=1445661 RepID=A0A4S3MRY8_9RHOB|nr:GlsB/YeaQ/YmgE family stress response membrane protein [Gemmobacter aestuarii]THD85298.1 GlsB/YeaQ/YmgE family stress response membrane protein [Gemmobacter aestuarii]